MAGVPQGSTLDSILFNIYINDIPKTKNIYASLFVDDLYLGSFSTELIQVVNRLNKKIHKIYKFYNKWKIKINASKTEAIIFSKRRPTVMKNIVVNNVNVCWSKSIKYLGVHLDAKLTFTKHVNFIAQKSLGSLIKY